MRRTLLWILLIGLVATSFTGCGGATSSITGPTFREIPDAER